MEETDDEKDPTLFCWTGTPSAAEVFTLDAGLDGVLKGTELVGQMLRDDGVCTEPGAVRGVFV